MAIGFVAGGYKKHAFSLLDRPEVKLNKKIYHQVLKNIVSESLLCGAIKMIDDLLLFLEEDAQAIKLVIVKMIKVAINKKSIFFSNQKSCIKNVAAFHPQFQLAIIEEIESQGTKVITGSTAEQSVRTIQKVRSNMLSRGLTFEQSVVIMRPDVRGLYANFLDSMIRFFPIEILPLIVIYLCGIDPVQAFQLKDFFSIAERSDQFGLIQDSIVQAVSAYVDTSKDQKADAFAKRCRMAESEEELSDLLSSELLPPNPANTELDVYQAIICAHYKELQQLDTDENQYNKVAVAGAHVRNRFRLYPPPAMVSTPRFLHATGAAAEEGVVTVSVLPA